MGLSCCGASGSTERTGLIEFDGDLPKGVGSFEIDGVGFFAKVSACGEAEGVVSFALGDLEVVDMADHGLVLGLCGGDTLLGESIKAQDAVPCGALFRWGALWAKWRRKLDGWFAGKLAKCCKGKQ